MDFISDQLSRTGQPVQSVRNLIPYDMMSPQLQIKYDWLLSEEKLTNNYDFKLLQTAVKQCEQASTNFLGRRHLQQSMQTQRANVTQRERTLNWKTPIQ